MSKKIHDEYREKFRPGTDSELDREIDAALGDLSVEKLMDEDHPQQARTAGGARHGKVIRIDADDVFVDFGGKSQGIVPREQFEEEPNVGDDIEVHVERFDPHEGLLILNRKGAVATNATWENLEVGQI